MAITNTANIVKEVGLLLRDLLRADTAFMAIVGRAAEDSVFFTKPDQDTALLMGLRYPLVRVDLYDGRDVPEQTSIDGTEEGYALDYIVNAWDTTSGFTCHDLIARANVVFKDSAEISCANLIFDVSTAFGYDDTEVNDEDKNVFRESLRVFLNIRGRRT